MRPDRTDGKRRKKRSYEYPLENDKKSCAIIIQARMSSRRFQGKMMSRIFDMPLIGYIYRRCAKSAVKKIIVATSDDKSDDVLCNYCKDNGIPVLRGSLDNVLDRYIKAADSLAASHVVRICGDTPFFDISLMDTMLDMLIREGLDYVSLNKETCAAGFYSETVALQALKKAASLACGKEDLEHVTKYIVDHRDKFSVKFLDAGLNPEFAKKARLTIDYPEDIKRANEIIDKLRDKLSFTSEDILDIVRERAAMTGFPQRVEIELASACNLMCTYCPRKHLGSLSGFMKFSLFKKLIDEIAGYPETVLVLHRRGESLLHPDFIEICGYVKGKFKEVQLATNATLLDDSKSKAIIDAAHFISFSLDISEVFNKTRVPAQYGKVENNILHFLKLNKGRVRTQVSMVETQGTPSENREIFTRTWKGKVDRIRIYEEHSRDGRFGSLARARGERLPCVMPFYETLIYCDGRAGRCNHDWNGMPMGDVNNSTIKSIWNSPLYEDLRRQHRVLCIKDEVCKNCDSWYAKAGKQGTGDVIENY